MVLQRAKLAKNEFTTFPSADFAFTPNVAAPPSTFSTEAVVVPTVVVNIEDTENVAVIDIPRDYLAHQLFTQTATPSNTTCNETQVLQIIENLQYNELLAEILHGKPHFSFF